MEEHSTLTSSTRQLPTLLPDELALICVVVWPVFMPPCYTIHLLFIFPFLLSLVRVMGCVTDDKPASHLRHL